MFNLFRKIRDYFFGIDLMKNSVPIVIPEANQEVVQYRHRKGVFVRLDVDTEGYYWLNLLIGDPGDKKNAIQTVYLIRNVINTKYKNIDAMAKCNEESRKEAFYLIQLSLAYILKHTRTLCLTNLNLNNDYIIDVSKIDDKEIYPLLKTIDRIMEVELKNTEAFAMSKRVWVDITESVLLDKQFSVFRQYID